MEQKTCSLCNDSFTCNSSNISHCWCSELSISTAGRQALASRSTDCVCRNCLQKQEEESQGLSPRKEGGRLAYKLQEGTHYYFEAGRMVLTARYLQERGYCCGNGCRHCPYR